MEYFTEDNIYHDLGFNLTADMSTINKALGFADCYDAGEAFKSVELECDGDHDHEYSCCYWTFKKKKDAKNFVKLFNQHLTQLLHDKSTHIPIMVKDYKSIQFTEGTIDEMRLALDQLEIELVDCTGIVFEVESYGYEIEGYRVSYLRPERESDLESRLSEERREIKARETRAKNEEQRKINAAISRKENAAARLVELQKRIEKDKAELAKLKDNT